MPNPDAPAPRAVIAGDGTKIATYEWGDPDASTVLLVHGFASSALGNWNLTGWVRDLLRAGYHVIATDQRGHGASDKPHRPEQYSMPILADDADHLAAPQREAHPAHGLHRPLGPGEGDGEIAHREHVVGQDLHRVLLGVVRLVARAMAALVDSDHVVLRPQEVPHPAGEVPVAERARGEPVHEQRGGGVAVAPLVGRYLRAVGGDHRTRCRGFRVRHGSHCVGCRS